MAGIGQEVNTRCAVGKAASRLSDLKQIPGVWDRCSSWSEYEYVSLEPLGYRGFWRPLGVGCAMDQPRQQA